MEFAQEIFATYSSPRLANWDAAFVMVPLTEPPPVNFLISHSLKISEVSVLSGDPVDYESVASALGDTPTGWL